MAPSFIYPCLHQKINSDCFKGNSLRNLVALHSSNFAFYDQFLYPARGYITNQHLVTIILILLGNDGIAHIQ